MSTSTLNLEHSAQQERETVSTVSSRVALLDVLRGFASLGILLFNSIAFSGWAFLSPSAAAAFPGSSLDSALMHGLVALVEGKFYSLFSMLFGIGFAIIIRRAEQRDSTPTPILLRRYFFLLIIGLVHTVFIWYGDILVLYALLGFVLLGCRGLSDRALIRCSIVLLLLPIPLYGLGLWLSPAALGDGGLAAKLPAALHSFASGSYPDIVAGNVVITEFNWLRRLILMFYPRVLGMFLLGVALSRTGVFQSPDRHAAFFRTFARLGLLVGLPASILYSALDQRADMLPLTANGFLRTACDSIGSPLLCLGYVSWLAIAFRKPVAQRLLLWLVPVGRMALSNYLFQSVVSVLLFYGIGGRLFMRVSFVASLIIALLIFSIQVLISRAYLRSFQQGPAESVWRRLTYGALR